MTTGSGSDPSDDEVVQTAAQAAEEFIFARLDRSAVKDIDVTVKFVDGTLDIDVYLNAPAVDVDIQRVADDAARAGRTAVDDLFAE